MQRAPAFAVMVVATLAIGLGATAAMFTVVNHVLLEVLLYHDARQLVIVRESGRPGELWAIPWLDVDAWRQKATSFDEIAFYPNERSVTLLEGDAGAQQIDFDPISTNTFHVLGVVPAIGRGFADTHGDGFADPGDENRCAE